MKSVEEVLSPLLIISNVFGLRLWIIDLSIGHLRSWFSVSYMLLFWLIYFFFFKFTVIPYIKDNITDIFDTTYYYLIYIWLEIFITLLSVMLGIYYNKKFSNCLKKLDIVDDTLLKVGITTDYHKLHKKSVWFVLGWFIIIIFLNCEETLIMIIESNSGILIAIYISFMRNYCYYINVLHDLIIASVFGYIKLKFDQVNGYLLNLSKNNKCEIKWISQNPVSLSHQHKFPKAPSNEWMTWILIHLHLELRRISYEINSIFGIQMTFKMGYYFFSLALDLDEIFVVILDYDVKYNNRILYFITMIFWILLDVFNLFLINYICEIVSAKANATGNLINRMPYFTYNNEIRENISQFLFQMAQMPVRFYGIGFFQFGYKFLQGFTSSLTTVLVLLIDGHIKENSLYEE